MCKYCKWEGNSYPTADLSGVPLNVKIRTKGLKGIQKQVSLAIKCHPIGKKHYQMFGLLIPCTNFTFTFSVPVKSGSLPDLHYIQLMS